MSLISLNSNDEDPADFTNRLQSNLRLPPNTSLRVLQYSLNVVDADEKIIVSADNDTMTLGFGVDDYQTVFSPIEIKIPHGQYPSDGVYLCQEMSRVANASLANGRLPGYCGVANATDGIQFTMNAGKIKLSAQVQAFKTSWEGDWANYVYPGTDYQPSTITFNSGGGSTQVTADTEKPNFNALYNQLSHFFPIVPRFNGAGIPDPGAFGAGPTEGFLAYNMGSGPAVPTATPEKWLQGGGIVWRPATRYGEELPIPGVYSGDDDWANSNKQGIWVNHGFRLVKGPGNGGQGTLCLELLRGEPNEKGGAGELHTVIEQNLAGGMDVGLVWDLSVYIRIVANNTGASPDADGLGFVSQIWITSGSEGLPLTLVDEYPLTIPGKTAKTSVGDFTGAEHTNPMCQSAKLYEVWKCLSPGTGVVGDDLDLKIVSNSGPATGNITGGPGWDGSIQTSSWVFSEPSSYQDLDPGLPQGDPSKYNGGLMELSKLANCGTNLGYENPSYFLMKQNTSVADGWEANLVLNKNINAGDKQQNILVQIPNLPIYGRLGATGDIAPIVACARKRSVYNGDTETGAVWYEYQNPPQIDLNNEAEIILNELNVKLTDLYGVKIQGLEKHTSLLLEFFPNPPSAIRPHQSARPHGEQLVNAIEETVLQSQNRRL